MIAIQTHLPSVMDEYNATTMFVQGDTVATVAGKQREAIRVASQKSIVEEYDHIEFGSAQPQKKTFTTLSAMSLGCSITNTGLGMMLIVSYTVFGAGPLFIYGITAMFLVSICVAVSLGEMVSAYPHTGGQYFWVAQLAPERSRRFLSYMTAIISWASVICTVASGAAGCTTLTFALIACAKPEFDYKPWMQFLCYLGYTWTSALMTIFRRPLPRLLKFMLYYSLIGLLGLVICLLAPDKEKQSAGVVFGAGEYFNKSGWPDGMAFLIGIGGVNWGFCGIDSATHLAEEIPEPRKNIPKVLLYTIGIGFIFGLSVNLAIFFAATDLDNTTSILGLVNIVYDGDLRCAYALGSVAMVFAWGSVIGGHMWHTRIAWSLSRNKGFPFHSHLRKLAPAPFHTPLWALLWGTCWVSLCGCLYLVSLTAFNAIINSAVVLQYFTYSLCALLLLRKGRKNFNHGPFWHPRFGHFANIVLIVWTALSTVIYVLPYYLPVEAGNMNYVSVVLVVAFGYAGLYWVLYGRTHFILEDLRVALD